MDKKKEVNVLKNVKQNNECSLKFVLKRFESSRYNPA